MLRFAAPPLYKAEVLVELSQAVRSFPQARDTGLVREVNRGGRSNTRRFPLHVASVDSGTANLVLSLWPTDCILSDRFGPIQSPPEANGVTHEIYTRHEEARRATKGDP